MVEEATVPLPDWDETTRPTTSAYDEVGADERTAGEHLRAIHDMYRQGLAQVAHVLDQVVDGAAGIGEAREAVQQLGLRTAVERAGSFCGQLCRAVETHHRIEDAYLYPALRIADGGLGPVLDRLDDEHVVVHELLVRLDATLVAVARDPGRVDVLLAEFTHLRRLLESHFVYEEDQIGGALGVHRITV
ncbi:hemerythrin domain-containing protein [Nocardioides sp. CFH 31398]|uniref:hemerythrin domain-containing protein n=1 Tax=Nocardioides sp. CFH 31398 TaxID=2919579 RepID=UPI001F066774|nr:hemerythrin domain-containing protein [Nocardioides sp. CFH 31398]MCH1868406.1 hemerythrin domain-containing protein [Nocardioides sp. CFH 31398]